MIKLMLNFDGINIKKGINEIKNTDFKQKIEST